MLVQTIPFFLFLLFSLSLEQHSIQHEDLSSSTGKTCEPYLQGNSSVPCWLLEGSCYCFPDFMARTWMSAERYCGDWNMSLVSLQSPEKHNLIANHILDPANNLQFNGREFWTSGSFVTSQWLWTATDEPFTYTNWLSGQPNEDIDGSCALMYFLYGEKGSWADNSCRYATHFICEDS